MQTYPKGLAGRKLKELITSSTLHEIAKKLKGDVNGEWINIPGPGHNGDDRSLGIKLQKNAPNSFIVHSLAGDDPRECRKYVNAKLAEAGIQLPHHRAAEREGRSNPDASKAQHAFQIWSESIPASGTPVDTYLQGRGITCPIPVTIRFHGNLRNGAGIYGPAMVALVTKGTDDEPLGF
jgi:putative DNA primase/helicase